MRDPLEQFERESAALVERLAEPSPGHVPDLSYSNTSAMPLGGSGYSGYGL